MNRPAMALITLLLLTGTARPKEDTKPDPRNQTARHLDGGWALDATLTDTLNGKGLVKFLGQKFSAWQFESGKGKPNLSGAWRTEGLADGDPKDYYRSFALVGHGRSRQGAKGKLAQCSLAQAHGATWLLWVVPNYGILRAQVQLVRGSKPSQDLLFLRYASPKAFTVALRRQPSNKGPK
jgi:hypothetical protein